MTAINNYAISYRESRCAEPGNSRSGSPLPSDRRVMSRNAHNRIFAIILAAGTSSRFGRLKQIEPVDDTCLLGIVIGNALRSEEIERIIVVLGAEAAAVERALEDIIENDKIEIVINDEYEKGLSASLRVGLERARACGCDAVTFLLGDMPMIDASLIDAIVSRYRSSDSKLCYVKSDGRPGHPIIAGKDMFDEFLSISGDIGGREVVRRYIGRALGIDIGGSAGDLRLDIGGSAGDHRSDNSEKDVNHRLDIDTPKDMEIYRSYWVKHSEN